VRVIFLEVLMYSPAILRKIRPKSKIPIAYKDTFVKNMADLKCFFFNTQLSSAVVDLGIDSPHFLE
jgi:hypothetical protein